MDIKQRLELQKKLEKIVKKVSKDLLSYTGSVEDIPNGKTANKSHQDCSIDKYARGCLLRLIGDEFAGREMRLHFELEPILTAPEIPSSEGVLYFLIDEIDGTTNMKRWLTSERNYKPHAAICVAVCSKTSIGGIEVGVVCTLDADDLYSAYCISRTDFTKFCAYHDGKPIVPAPVKTGDSRNRLLVIGYSNNARIQKAKIEEALYALDDCIVYEGCRSSTIDIINIFRNQYDAYIDARALFGKKSRARLETYDVAAILPMAYAHSLSVFDIYGRSLEAYDWSDPLPLVVARPEVYDQIRTVLDTLIGSTLPTLGQWEDILKKERIELKMRAKRKESRRKNVAIDIKEIGQSKQGEQLKKSPRKDSKRESPNKN